MQILGLAHLITAAGVLFSPAETTGPPPAPEACVASWHDHTGDEPALTANGEEFDPEGLTAAHEDLAFDTMVKVTRVNDPKKRSVIVRINDRWSSDRCINLAKGAFEKLAPLEAGVVKVTLEPIPD